MGMADGIFQSVSLFSFRPSRSQVVFPLRLFEQHRDETRRDERDERVSFLHLVSLSIFTRVMR